MIDLDVPESAVSGIRKHSRRRMWAVLGAVVAVVAGGVIAAVAVSLRYLHATPLSSGGNGGWIGADSAHVRSVTAGPYTADVIRPRPGHPQSFDIDLVNPSGVSQTVLGLVDGRTLANPRLTGEPETVQVSPTSVFLQAGQRPRFGPTPVTIPPGGDYSLRFTEVTAHGLWRCGRSESVTDLMLRVRVGIFTRVEDVSLAPSIMEIQTARTAC
jgi:hypothetical protein